MRVSGEQALAGWRSTVADAVATPVDRFTPLAASRVRALIGWAFLGLAVLYVARTVREMGR